MTSHRTSRAPVEVVTLDTQDERDRLAMIMMQLDMALALAREKRLVKVETYLESALAEARSINKAMLN